MTQLLSPIEYMHYSEPVPVWAYIIHIGDCYNCYIRRLARQCVLVSWKCVAKAVSKRENFEGSNKMYNFCSWFRSSRRHFWNPFNFYQDQYILPTYRVKLKKEKEKNHGLDVIENVHVSICIEPPITLKFDTDSMFNAVWWIKNGSLNRKWTTPTKTQSITILFSISLFLYSMQI